MTEIEQKAIKEMEAMLEEHFIANNHSNCDVGYSYSEIQFCKERDIKGVAHSIATALVKAGYRKRSDTVKEFAQNAISRVFEGITQRFYDCYNDGLLRGYPDSELSWNFFRAFDECKDIAKKEINELAEQFGKEEK